MSSEINTQKTFKATQELLQDIESELHFLSPHSAKIVEIRNMIHCLKSGNAIEHPQCSEKTQEMNWPNDIDEACNEMKTENFDLFNPTKNALNNED